jgi:hypothetical protein
MKRIINFNFFLAAAMLVGTFAVVTAQTQQPLGDYARNARKDKDKDPKSAKKYDNDNLPVNDKLSIVGPAEPEAPAAGTALAAPTGAAAATPAPGSSVADKQKLNDDWKAKITTQKDQISLASRELDVAQREYRLRAAAMYADAGNRLRNSADWDKEDAKYKQQILQKQKAVDDAKKKLDDMQEQARKAGVSSSARE